MFNFRSPSSTEPLFEAAYKVEKIMDVISEIQILHPTEPHEIPEDIKKVVLDHSFPLQEKSCCNMDDDIAV